MAHSKIIGWVGLGAVLALSGCRDFEATAPAGFAAFEDPSAFRAVSPDGVTYLVRSEANEPFAKLSFWQEALKKRMVDAGYAFVSDSEVKAGPRTGYLLELAAPVGVEDYTYLIAIFARGEDLLIVESAGEVTRFVQHRDAIIKAIAGVK